MYDLLVLWNYRICSSVLIRSVDILNIKLIKTIVYAYRYMYPYVWICQVRHRNYRTGADQI